MEPKKEIGICRLPLSGENWIRSRQDLGCKGLQAVVGQREGEDRCVCVWLVARTCLIDWQTAALKNRNLAETARHQVGFAVVPKLTEQSK